MPEEPAIRPAANPQFQSTHWSLVLKAADRAAPDYASAMAALCEAYWYPLYAYARRRGHSAAEAEDLTQEFFARVLDKGYFAGADREKGKFRTFLLACMKRFLANQWDHANAQKRGGGRTIRSLDAGEAEHRYALEPTETATPEAIFDRRWALTLLDHVLEQLADSYRESGKAELFEQLKGYLVGDRGLPSYREVAESLGQSEGAIKVAVHRLRTRYRDLLRTEIARTLDEGEDVDAEIRTLFAALGEG